jgi:hypothetical protein
LAREESPKTTPSSFQHHITMSRPSPNFWLLPRELQLHILESLPFSDYVNFALAAYFQLRIAFPDYFPAVIPSRLQRMRRAPPSGSDPLQALPNEMIINIARYIDRRYMLRWVFAHYHTLSNSNPPLVPQLDAQSTMQMILSWLRLDRPHQGGSDSQDSPQGNPSSDDSPPI